MKRNIIVILSIAILVAFAVTSLGLVSIAVKSIKLNTGNVTLQVGKTYTLKVTITPTDATIKKLTYSSGNKNIATVDKNGKIKGIKPGKTVITVTSASNKKAVAKCNVTISQVAIIDVSYWNAIWQGGMPAENNTIQQELVKRTGVNVKQNVIMIVTWKELAQKLNTIAASNGDWEDVAKVSSDADAFNIIKQLGDADLLWDIKPYIDQYPNLKKVIKGPMSRYEVDGKWYCWPTWICDGAFDTPMSYLAVRKDLFTQLNIQYPKTPDELINMLKLAKEKFKAPNGKSIIPLVSIGEGRLLNAFFCTTRGTSYFAEDVSTPNTNVSMPMFQDKNLILKYCNFINTLSREKLIDQEFLSSTRDQVIEKLASGSAFAFSGLTITDAYPVNDALMKSNKDAYFVQTPLVFDNYNKRKLWSGQNPFGNNLNIINKKKVDENKLKAILKVIDYLASEDGHILTSFGRVGVESQKNDKGQYEYTADYKAKTHNGTLKDLMHDGIYLYADLIWLLSIDKKVSGTDQLLSRPDGVESVNNVYGGTDMKSFNKFSPPNDEFYTVVYDGPVYTSKIKGLNDTYTKLIAAVSKASGSSEVENLVDKYLSDCKAAGVDEMVAEKVKMIKEKYKLN